MKNLKKRWKIQSNGQVFIILLVFAITGSSAAKLTLPIAETFDINKEMDWFIYWPFRIIITLILYQILLVFYGWVFGMFNFFWNFEKRMLRAMGLRFLIKD